MRALKLDNPQQKASEHQQQPWTSPAQGPDPAFLVCLPILPCPQLGRRKSSAGADGAAEGKSKSSLSTRTHMGHCSRSRTERLKALLPSLALLPCCSKTLGKITSPPRVSISSLHLVYSDGSVGQKGSFHCPSPDPTEP